jgi:hypothetical protein
MPLLITTSKGHRPGVGLVVSRSALRCLQTQDDGYCLVLQHMHTKDFIVNLS